MFIDAGEVVVDIVRMACLGRSEDRELRIGVKRARVMARSATMMVVTSAFENVWVVVSWLVVAVPVIRKEVKIYFELPRVLYTALLALGVNCG
jgi:hypothetical protein